MRPLYKIREQRAEVLKRLHDAIEAGLPEQEVADIEGEYDNLDGELEEKVLSRIAWANGIEAEAKWVGAEIDRLSARRRTLSAERDRLIERTKRDMEAVEIKKVVGTEEGGIPLSATICKSTPRVDVFDPAILPVEFVKVKEERGIDKKAVKTAIDAGVAVPGARLVQGSYLRIS